jgi:hypothetical protein
MYSQASTPVGLRAGGSDAAAGLPISRLVLHEPPYVPDDEDERQISREYAGNLETTVECWSEPR